MPTTSFHDPTLNNRRYEPTNRSKRFCCPGDDERRSFSMFPVSTTMCCLLQALTLAGLIAGTVTAYWRMKQWSVGDFTYRRFWGLWQACTRVYAEHGLRLRAQKCYSRFHHSLGDESSTVDGRLLLKEEDFLDEWEMSVLALMIFASVHALVGLLLHVVCCLRSPCCLVLWAGAGMFICGSGCVIYFTHFLQAKELHDKFQQPTIMHRIQESLELGWSFHLAVASTFCQILLIGSMIAFGVYATKRRQTNLDMMRMQTTQIHYRSRESVV